MGWWKRMFGGGGTLTPELREALTAEGIVVLAEGLPGSVTFRQVRAAGGYASWKKRRVWGAVAVTRRRTVITTGDDSSIWQMRFKHIDIPLDHPLRSQLEVVATEPDGLLVAYDLAQVDNEMSGRVEVRFRVADAQHVAAAIKG